MDESHVSMRSLLHTKEVVRDCRRRKASVVETGDVRKCNQEDGYSRRRLVLSRWLAVSEWLGASDGVGGTHSIGQVFGPWNVESEGMNAALAVRPAKGTFTWRTSRRQRPQWCGTAT